MCISTTAIDAQLSEPEAEEVWRNPVTGHWLPGKGGPGWKHRTKDGQLLDELKRGLLMYSPQVVALVPLLLQSKTEKTQIALLRLYVEMFIPKEVVQKIWQVSLKGDVQSLQAHTQQYAEFLAWKGRKELEAQGIDVDAIDREREGVECHDPGQSCTDRATEAKE